MRYRFEPGLRAGSFVAAFVATVMAAGCGGGGGDKATGTDTTTTTGSFSDTITCDASTQLTLTVGQVKTGLPASGVCVGVGNASEEYALVAYNTTTVSSANTSIEVNSSGVSNTSAITFNPARLSLDLAQSVPVGASMDVKDAFETKLRAIEQAEVSPLVPAARTALAARSRRGFSANAIPSNPTVGQILALNTNANSSCTSPIIHGARVAAITNTAIVVADTLNPPGGFTDAEYAAFGATFDSVINPLDTNAFGSPTDIDGNGKIVIFFTGTVNQLTPKNSGEYIGGFFYSRDLIPTSSCAGSNFGEMFYVLVPDPTGADGNVFQKGMVDTVTEGTIAHEYQHLINGSRRLYVNAGAAPDEEVWLNEGLSHVAEELLYYHKASETPRSNINAAGSVSGNATQQAVFRAYQLQNFLRLEDYMKKPTLFSPYAENDSLQTRGATWSFLRYAADQSAATDGTIWRRLVNSTTTGMANLTNVYGSSLPTYLQNWAIALFTDDLTAGFPAQYQHPSWNFHSIYVNGFGGYPLTPGNLNPGSEQAPTILSGGAAYWRFSVISTRGSVAWSAPSNISFTLIRTK